MKCYGGGGGGGGGVTETRGGEEKANTKRKCARARWWKERGNSCPLSPRGGPRGLQEGGRRSGVKGKRKHKYESATTPNEGWLPSACPEKKKAKQKRILRERERRN